MRPSPLYLATDGHLNLPTLLLRDAMREDFTFGEDWFGAWLAWQTSAASRHPTTKRLNHVIAMHAALALNEQKTPCNPTALSCLVHYLNALEGTSAQELTTLVWQHHGALQQACNTSVSTPATEPWCGPTHTTTIPTAQACVLDAILTVFKTLNASVRPNTVYRHCAPLLVKLINHPGWNPCALIAHFYTLRQVQFEHLNAKTRDLPGEMHTVHGTLAYYLFAYMHSSAWRPQKNEHTKVLDRLVWSVLCLSDLGGQSIGWLDTLTHCLPKAGLSSLYASIPGQMPAWTWLTPIHTPAFSSLGHYAQIARQDRKGPFNRAHAFERRHPRLAHAMQTYLMVLPGTSAAGDWDALNEWWRVDVQGLDHLNNDVFALPEDFELTVH